MNNKELSFNEIKAKKEALQDKIKTLIDNFESETGFYIDEIRLKIDCLFVSGGDGIKKRSKKVNQVKVIVENPFN